MRYKVAVRFVIEGDLRFISHHDTMRLFERALSRAELPVRFSHGYNPRPRLSLPVPRPVGVASEAELLVVELREPMESAVLLERLARQMPTGLTLVEASIVPAGGVPRPDRVAYAVPVAPHEIDGVAGALRRLMAAETWPIERRQTSHKPARTIDLRAHLIEASIRDGTLRWVVKIAEAGSARPAEFLAALGLEPADWLCRARRSAIGWSAENGTPSTTAAPQDAISAAVTPPSCVSAARTDTDVTRAHDHDRPRKRSETSQEEQKTTRGARPEEGGSRRDG